MSYQVKEIFLTLQGEGGQAGRAAVFCRFAGCNLWSGREADRDRAVCSFCDTDFVGTDGPGGGKFRAAGALAAAVARAWRGAGEGRLAVLTGGEPLLQVDAPLIEALHAEGFSVAIETNGTLPAPPGLDWICVSPKAGAPLAQRSGQELKLVYPQAGVDPAAFESLAFERFSLQPMDGPHREAATRAAIDYCLAHPRWRLSLQTHKFLGHPLTQPVFEITKAAAFDAAHRLPSGPEEGRYARLHGHSFRVEATLRGAARPPIGWVEDLGDLDAALREIAGGLDHSLLNDATGLENPTLEALCLYFADRLKPRFAALVRIAVSRPSVGERCELETA